MKKICVIGEILFRFSNKHSSTFNNSNEIIFNYGGAEYNVACNLGYWKNNVSFISKINKNWLSNNSISHLKSFGVNTDLIIDDKINTKVGIYYLQQFNGGINNKVHYDRKNSSFCNWNNNEIPIEDIIKNYDVFYISGISFAVSEKTRDELLILLKILKNNNKTIIFDFNYRQKLWDYPLAKKIIEKILPFVDIAFCGIKDISLILKIKKFVNTDFDENKLIESYNSLFKVYPNLKLLASSNRKILDNSSQEYTGYLYDGNQLSNTSTYTLKNIVDRIGTGDAFAAGIVHGYINNYNQIDMLNFGTKSAILKHYYYGDNEKLEIDFINEITEFNNDVSR